MLEVQNLSMRFGGLLAVDQVSLDVQEHEIVAIIGPNGAGKTTVFNCMSGFYKPTGGKILFQGGEIQGKPDFKISRLGLVRTFQHVRLFSRMTVVENLLVAQSAATLPGGDAEREFLNWRTLTFVPIDRRLIVVEMLTAAERAGIDSYHAEVVEKIGPRLGKTARMWLDAAAAPL